VASGSDPRSCGFQQGNAPIRKSNQHGWLIPKLLRLQAVCRKRPSRSCGFQQRNALIRKSNQRGWLIPKLRRLQAVGNLDPVVFSQAMLQFEDLLSMAGSFQNFFDLNYSRRSLV
jgi:hypothetical protein